MRCSGWLVTTTAHRVRNAMTVCDPFWEYTALEDMDEQQWESLCDGCGRCCLQKLEDSDTGDVYFTSVACRMLDLVTCRCKDYPNRRSLVPDCTMVRPLTPEKQQWLPESCAYRRLAAGKALPAWHPLVSGDADSVHRAGISVGEYARDETSVPLKDYQQHIIHFSPYK